MKKMIPAALILLAILSACQPVNTGLGGLAPAFGEANEGNEAGETGLN